MLLESCGITPVGSARKVADDIAFPNGMISTDDHMAEWVDTVRIRALACILEFDLKR